MARIHSSLRAAQGSQGIPATQAQRPASGRQSLAGGVPVPEDRGRSPYSSQRLGASEGPHPWWNRGGRVELPQGPREQGGAGSGAPLQSQTHRSSGESTWNVLSMTVVHCKQRMMKVLGRGRSTFISWHSGRGGRGGCWAFSEDKEEERQTHLLAPLSQKHVYSPQHSIVGGKGKGWRFAAF